MSRRIARLERALGVQLFRRTMRRMEMTPAGALFLARVQPGLELLQQAHDETARTTEGAKGLLRVAYRPTVAVRLRPRC
jgi:DNA-binding transcriptional LysR family regulator